MTDIVTLFDGFDECDFAPCGGLYYKDNPEQRAGNYEFQNEVAFSGRGALKLSVGKQKAPKELESERAEVWEKTDLRVTYGAGVWYGFAVKFADPVPADDHRYVIAQWKREITNGASGDFSPFFALRLRNGKLYATVETNFRPNRAPTAHDPQVGSVPVFLRPAKNQMRALVATDSTWTPDQNGIYSARTDQIRVKNHGSDLPLPDSGWIDFVIYTRPCPEGNGRIELFANSKHIATVTGMIGHNDSGLGKSQYFKFGPYRARHVGEWTVFFDDFRRSTDHREVFYGGDLPVTLDSDYETN